MKALFFGKLIDILRPPPPKKKYSKKYCFATLVTSQNGLTLTRPPPKNKYSKKYSFATRVTSQNGLTLTRFLSFGAAKMLLSTLASTFFFISIKALLRRY
jgi:hypothetical protein